MVGVVTRILKGGARVGGRASRILRRAILLVPLGIEVRFGNHHVARAHHLATTASDLVALEPARIQELRVRFGLGLTRQPLGSPGARSYFFIEFSCPPLAMAGFSLFEWHFEPEDDPSEKLRESVFVLTEGRLFRSLSPCPV